MYHCSFVIAYRNEEGLPWVLPVVRTVEAQMSTDLMLNHEYLPLDGLKAFTDSATKLLLGGDSPAITQNRVRCYWILLYLLHYIAFISLVLCFSSYFWYRKCSCWTSISQ